MAISWTKLWSSSDDGTVLTGAHLETLQSDISSGTVSVGSNNTWTGTNTFNNTITFNDSSNNDMVTIDNDGTGHGLYIKQDGILAASKYGLYLYSNAVQANGYLAKIHLDNSSSTISPLVLTNDGTGTGFSLGQVGNGISMQITNQGTKDGLYIYQQVETATAAHAFSVFGSVAQTNVNSATVKFTSAGSSTEPLLELNNDGTGDDIETDSGAKLTAAGVWTDASGRESKENFIEENVLDRIKRLQVSKYNYKKLKNRKHFSPVAEDFYSLFGLGDNKGIAPKDLGGIALQGIKELVARVEVLEAK